MFHKDRFDVRMLLKDSDKLRATVSSKPNYSDGRGHGDYLFTLMNKYTITLGPEGVLVVYAVR
jgi:hypothetical protein